METEIHKTAFLMNYGSPKHQEAAKPKADKLIADVHADPQHDHADMVISSGMTKGEDLHKFLTHHQGLFRRHAARNPNLSADMVDHLSRHGDYHQLHGIATNTHVKLQPEHVTRIINYKLKDGERVHPATHIALFHTNSIQAHHWHSLICHQDESVAKNTVMNENIPQQHLENAAKFAAHSSVRMEAHKRIGERQHQADIAAQEARGGPDPLH